MSRQAFSMAAMAWDVSPPAVDPDERGAEAVDQGGHALAAALVELGPSRDAFVGGDLQERIGVPPAVGVEVLELDDLHSVPRVWCFWHVCCADKAHKIVPWFADDTNRSAELGRHAISPTRSA